MFHIIIGMFVISDAVNFFDFSFKLVMGVRGFSEAMANAGVAMMLFGVSSAVVFDFIGVRSERRNGEESGGEKFFHGLGGPQYL